MPFGCVMMSTSPNARTIDRELGNLDHDLIGQTLLFSYLRYNVELERDTLRDRLGLDLSPYEVAP